MSIDDKVRDLQKTYRSAYESLNKTRPIGSKLAPPSEAMIRKAIISGDDRAFYARDEAPSSESASDPGGLSAEGLARVISYLRAKLSKDDLASVESIIAEATGNENDLASDAAPSKGFAARYPGAAAIRNLDPVPERRKPTRAADVAGFAERYPGAANIKLL